MTLEQTKQREVYQTRGIAAFSESMADSIDANNTMIMYVSEY